MPPTRQYDIQVGPFTAGAPGAPGTPDSTIALNDNQTNLSYFKVHMMDDALPLGLMFSRGGFSTNLFETHSPVVFLQDSQDSSDTVADVEEPGRSLWLLNLVPVRLAIVPDHINEVPPIPDTFRLQDVGTILHLDWGKKYVVQPERHQTGVLIRPVDLHPSSIDEEPHHTVHRYGGDPNKRLRPAAAMTSLLSRLEAFTDT